MLNWRASDSLFRGLAKILGKLLKLKTGKLNKRKSTTRAEIFSDANDAPPLHWLEKVAKGAPHLLVQPDENPLHSTPDNLYLRTEVKSTSYSKEKDRFTVQPAGNNALDSSEDKPRVIKKLDKQLVSKTVYETTGKIKKYFFKAEKEVKSHVDHIQETRQSHQQNRTTECVLNAQTKFKNPDRCDEDIIRPTLKTATLASNINAEYVKAKTSTATCVNEHSRENTTAVAVKNEQTLSNNRRPSQKPVHLYPNSKVCGNNIQKQQDTDNANKQNKADRVVAHDNSVISHQGYFKNASAVESANQSCLKKSTATASYFENSSVELQPQTTIHEAFPEKKPHPNQYLFHGSMVAQPEHIEIQSDSGWSNLSKDQSAQTVHDPWPNLPDIAADYLTGHDPSSTSFWKVLQENKYTNVSDNEQRSHLWNG